MLEIMLDINGWQGLFDFKSGEAISSPPDEFAMELSASHPYPGDRNFESIKWTTDFALDVAKKYNPKLLCISYATANLIRVNSENSPSEIQILNETLSNELKRFANETDYELVIVNVGELKPIGKLIDTSNIEGFISVSHDPYMAGVYGATAKDYESVKSISNVQYMLKDDFLLKYNITDEFAVVRTPDIILMADKGYCFKNMGNRGTPIIEMYEKGSACSICSTLPINMSSIFEVRPFIDSELAKGKKIALMVAESLDEKYMPYETLHLSKEKDGIHYTDSVVFYYALINGREFNALGMPYIFHNPLIRKKPGDRYPYSYIKTEHYQNPIGLGRDFKTAAVGTRSGIFHSACMCDYSFECHSRGLAESGILTFINTEKTWEERK
ncbi:MAG: hypothetical protein PUD72_08360 [Oscillospiraceae bacterium]|nr:hypothetical protein [Oscillospiraceae bacterium]